MLERTATEVTTLASFDFLAFTHYPMRPGEFYPHKGPYSQKGRRIKMSTPHREIANQLATFLVDTKYPDIPNEVVGFTKVLALKTIAGMLAGSTMPSSRKISKIIKDRKLPEGVGVIGCGFKTGLWEAIFLNSFFAHNSELEDDSFYGGSSWDITIIPLLFSLAQHLRLSGKAITDLEG